MATLSKTPLRNLAHIPYREISSDTKGIQAIHSTKIRRILSTLNTMKTLEPLAVYKLHPLKGELKGLWALTVQANWRITFKFDEYSGDVYIVDYQDYH